MRAHPSWSGACWTRRSSWPHTSISLDCLTVTTRSAVCIFSRVYLLTLRLRLTAWSCRQSSSPRGSSRCSGRAAASQDAMARHTALPVRIVRSLLCLRKLSGVSQLRARCGVPHELTTAADLRRTRGRGHDSGRRRSRAHYSLRAFCVSQARVRNLSLLSLYADPCVARGSAARRLQVQRSERGRRADTSQ